VGKAELLIGGLLVAIAGLGAVARRLSIPYPLAAALSIPLTVDGGAPFPDRELILFLTFAVIFVTLVVQGLSLPAVIRRLHISDDGAAESEELKARLGATKAALVQIDALAHSPIGEDRPATRSSRCRSRSRAVSSVVTVTRRGCGPSQRTTSSRE
jgi:hypothetical protein